MINKEEYDNKSNVYSFGVVLHNSFIGQIPNHSMKNKATGVVVSVEVTPSFEAILQDIWKNDSRC